MTQTNLKLYELALKNTDCTNRYVTRFSKQSSWECRMLRHFDHETNPLLYELALRIYSTNIVTSLWLLRHFDYETNPLLHELALRIYSTNIVTSLWLLKKSVFVGSIPHLEDIFLRHFDYDKSLLYKLALRIWTGQIVTSL